MPITQRQIADRLGISTTTISFVLNGQAEQNKIAPETVERVRTAAQEMGYRASYHARVLSGGKCSTLGLALESASVLTDRLWGPIAAGISEAAQKERYELLLISPHGAEHAVNRGVQYLQEKRLDSLLCIGNVDTTGVTDPDLPLVIIQGASQPLQFPSVSLDATPGIHEAVKHLAQLGHRSILRIGLSRVGQEMTPERSVAFRRAVKAADVKGSECTIPVKRPYSPHLEVHIAEYREGLQRALQLEPGMTAIMCFNDTMSLALYSVLAERGLKIPQDISVIGFDDLHAGHAIPALTTISHMLAELGAAAVDLAMIKSNKRTIPMTKSIAARLIVRQSTGPARRRTR